ncbi:16S rRNA (cytosine(1402)-N(4))-methyltransferase RsmH [Jatrophihabitans telluris]|uniref:Ribosomal RNA small subunit methyltransferase H n=1 Tax=Jatrophihabitans telluris TaxID=2038343 RepID=A0ABY4QWK2_9ACTN|nr:16S rRNA (cytosine(1402)-N(4))-methyltransferase RsmH [Jatrophihabitans telluris]UQX87196.1 16S rRNA (cytosine(1402)-N(4))-methyltransferase RsmH [Jatrophihabitans telluris]
MGNPEPPGSDPADPASRPASPDFPARPVHVPVLLNRVLGLLAPALAAADAVVVDATLGLGGHSEALLQAHPGLRLIGLDRDTEALRLSAERLAPFAARVELVHAVYDELPDILDRLGVGEIQGALFDLGVSSMQLDVTERGFSYSQPAPLDMRMNPADALTAHEVVNTYPVAELARVLREFGEERFALRIAQAIGRRRRSAPLESTTELAELVREAIPAATRRTGGHPAKRTFQALRIEVNRELEAVAGAIPAALSALAVGGRIVVLSYQSLEDRIVKRALAELAVDRTPPGLPVTLAEAGPQLQLLSRGSEPASEPEIAENPRAASVRLRAAERIRKAAA